MHLHQAITAALLPATLLCLSVTAHAQDASDAPIEATEPSGTDDILAELDQLAEAAADEASGLLLAQEQAKAGEFLQALSTVERVLALHPKSQSGRLLHAVYLCQIDDLPGGAAEMNKLKEKNFPEELWGQAQTLCKLDAGDVQ